MKHILLIFFLLTQYSQLLFSQTVSEYVNINHYTSKCAYCGQIKKDDKVDLSTIKDPEIYSNAAQYGWLNGALNNSGYEQKKICDISRTGQHRYEVIKKTTTKELFSVDKKKSSTSADTKSQNVNTTNVSQNIPPPDNNSTHKTKMYNAFYEYNSQALRNRNNLKEISKVQAEVFVGKFDYNSWSIFTEKQRKDHFNNFLNTFHHSKKYSESYEEASNEANSGWDFFVNKNEAEFALELIKRAIALNDSLAYAYSRQGLLELLRDKAKIMEYGKTGHSVQEIKNFDFWSSYVKFHNILTKEQDLIEARHHTQNAIKNLLILKEEATSNEKYFVDAINLVLTSFLNNDMAFYDTRIEENKKNQ